MAAARHRRLLALALAVALSTLWTSSASAQWRSRSGPCAGEWSALESMRGPLALVNGAVTPVRSTLGGLHFATAVCLRNSRCAPHAPAWFLWSVGWGVGQGAYFAVMGALDTITLGARPFSPPEAARVLERPMVPFLANDPPEGRC